MFGTLYWREGNLKKNLKDGKKQKQTESVGRDPHVHEVFLEQVRVNYFHICLEKSLNLVSLLLFSPLVGDRL